MPYQLGLPDALRRFGLKVELVPGWATRGASSLAPRGAISHWTAGPKGTKTRPSLNICVNGRAGLPGPLCNVYLDRAGIAVVVAAGVANHGGVGNWRGYSGNSRFFGTEAESGGGDDWTAAQRDAYPRVNAAFCWLGKFGPDMCCGHSEYATPRGRKVDINGYTMDAMRAQVGALLNPVPAPTRTRSGAAIVLGDDMPTVMQSGSKPPILVVGGLFVELRSEAERANALRAYNTGVTDVNPETGLPQPVWVEDGTLSDLIAQSQQAVRGGS